MTNSILDIRNLRKDFVLHILNDKHIEALHDLNFQINSGEVVGLAGKSGSGKSSLIKCIYRTYLATSGEILYRSADNQVIDLATASDYEILALRKSEITYCSQFLRVIPRVSAVDVVAEPLVIRGSDWESARSQARDYLQALGLPQELWDAFPATFSGGEQQRINVARAIIARPRFLLIDEPTASLDQVTKDVVIDLVLRLKAKGTSVLCISHDAYTMERLADRTIELKEGRLAA
ncbi:MAG: phosphonate C-P lyase system protein PhnL [Bacteroidota bacterium]